MYTHNIHSNYPYLYVVHVYLLSAKTLFVLNYAIRRFKVTSGRVGCIHVVYCLCVAVFQAGRPTGCFWLEDVSGLFPLFNVGPGLGCNPALGRVHVHNTASTLCMNSYTMLPW